MPDAGTFSPRGMEPAPTSGFPQSPPLDPWTRSSAPCSTSPVVSDGVLSPSEPVCPVTGERLRKTGFLCAL